MQKQNHFNNYVTDFEEKLDLIVIDEISTDLHCRTYLTHLLQHKHYYIAIYADVLNKLIRHTSKNKTTISMVDYGAGNGLLGVFAKFCGFKKVYINDINIKFIQASEKLATQLNIKIDGYITGDISAVQTYFKQGAPDAFIGTDVIEHIYNLGDFFACLQKINPAIVSVFTTASNPKNYFKVRMLKKMQVKDELEGGTPDDQMRSEQFAAEPFLKVREQIIRKHAAQLPETVIIKLARLTRGKNAADIVASVEEYLLFRKLPALPEHPTNTCDPLSSSWTERILSLKEYTQLYNFAGFIPVYYNGFYNEFEIGIKKYIKRILNIGIFVLGNLIAPYIIIVSYPGKKVE